MKLGELEISVVSGGRMWFDGGTIFGMVPKTRWNEVCPADEQNRVELDTNCLLVRSPAGVGLVETGYGSKSSPRHRANYGLEPHSPLLANLARRNVQPADVRWVTFTHLHFDHAGGSTCRENGRLRPTFPRARHYIQRAEWEDATADLPELAGSYLREDFEPLEGAGPVELVDGETQPVPGVRLKWVGGHTRGYQVISLESGSQTAVYLGDLCPTPAHLRIFWSTSFDQYPLSLRRAKADVLGEAADRHWLVLFGHDVAVKAAYLTRDERGHVVLDEVVRL